MNSTYSRAVKCLSVALVPALAALAIAGWSASGSPVKSPGPPEAVIDAPRVSLPPISVERPEPAKADEAVVELAPVLIKAEPRPVKPAQAKKPRTCGWYPMYESGDQRVWICS